MMPGHDTIELMCISAWKHFSKVKPHSPGWMNLDERSRQAFREGMKAATSLAMDAGELVSVHSGGPYYITKFHGTRAWSYHCGKKWHDGFETPEAALADAREQQNLPQ